MNILNLRDFVQISLLLLQVQCFSSTADIRSVWKNPSSCPAGHYANGLKIKYSQSAADELSNEMVVVGSVTAVALFCQEFGGSGAPNEENQILSSDGELKDSAWKNTQFCPQNDQFVVGFAVRKIPGETQYHKKRLDNVAVYCGTKDGPRDNTVRVEGDTKNRGNWDSDFLCPSGEAVCSIRAQMDGVVPFMPGQEITPWGTNDLEMKCCKIEKPPPPPPQESEDYQERGHYRRDPNFSGGKFEIFGFILVFIVLIE